MTKNSVTVRGIDARRTEILTKTWKAIIVKRVHDTERHWNSHTRVYGAVNTFAPELDEKIYENACSPAWGVGDGFTEETRVAHMKAYRKLKHDALAQVRIELVQPLALLHAQLGRFGTDVPTTKFSAKAGCTMCACSPGHILSTRWTLTGAPVDVWFERIVADSKSV